MKKIVLGKRYQLLQHIGVGGMSNVYKVKDLKQNKIVAAKIMDEALIHDAEFVQRFFREIKTTRRLSHNNIVNILDVGREEDMYYMIMEYVDGFCLKDLLKKRSFLGSREAIYAVIQICKGLDHAHSKGIIHRDIKPHNILISNDGQVKIADFGISRALMSGLSITKTGIVMGSVHYFSPEQARGLQINYTTDIYSVGILLYEISTGRLPFDGRDMVSVALNHIQQAVPNPKEYNKNLPDNLCGIIYKCLQKNPGQRYQRMDELIKDLKMVTGSDSSNVNQLQVASISKRMQRSKQNKNLKNRIPLALSILIVVVIWFFLWRLI